jgi:hypothetical protein
VPPVLSVWPAGELAAAPDRYHGPAMLRIDVRGWTIPVSSAPRISRWQAFHSKDSELAFRSALLVSP